MIYEIPKHKTTIDLSKVATISWKEHAPGDKVSIWRYILCMGMYFPRKEVKPHVRISPEKWYAVKFDYDTDKEAKKVYDDLVKAWKGE